MAPTRSCWSSDRTAPVATRLIIDPERQVMAAPTGRGLPANAMAIGTDWRRPWRDALAVLRGRRPSRWQRLLIGSALALCFAIGLGGCGTGDGQKPPLPANYNYERSPLLDVVDAVGDDKGPGTYMYPTDSRLQRGDFDLTRFSVYEEGDMVVFALQLRNYVKREWPGSRLSSAQGFVAQVFDIYIDTDRRRDSGHNLALPGRQLEFADRMGWEKCILVTPLDQHEVMEIMRNKTEDNAFDVMQRDVLVPDYVIVQRDRILVRISKSRLGQPQPNWGYQCCVLAYSSTVSSNQFLNRDVRAFPTREAIGGGYDTWGDPPVFDILVPPDADQYRLLSDFRSEPFADDIVRARIPFVTASMFSEDDDSARPAAIAAPPARKAEPVGGTRAPAGGGGTPAAAPAATGWSTLPAAQTRATLPAITPPAPRTTATPTGTAASQRGDAGNPPTGTSSGPGPAVTVPAKRTRVSTLPGNPTGELPLTPTMGTSFDANWQTLDLPPLTDFEPLPAPGATARSSNLPTANPTTAPRGQPATGFIPLAAPTAGAARTRPPAAGTGAGSRGAVPTASPIRAAPPAAPRLLQFDAR